MVFSSYRESILRAKKLAENFTGLNKNDVQELNKLIAECESKQKEIVSQFFSLIDEVEERLIHLMDRLGQIKNDLVKISGPAGTYNDILNLEPSWQQTKALRDNIRTLLDQTAKHLILPAEEIAATADPPAATSEKPSPKANKPEPAKTIKKPPPENKPAAPKLTPLVLNKNLGNEKKLLEEITKNIEMIKKNKKKP